MAASKTELFEQMVSTDPDNEMIWYGLASEYAKEEKWTEVVRALRKVIQIKVDYTAAYQLLGTALDKLGQVEEARETWKRGTEVAADTGAWKARDHMQGLLDATTIKSQ